MHSSAYLSPTSADESNSSGEPSEDASEPTQRRTAEGQTTASIPHPAGSGTLVGICAGGAFEQGEPGAGMVLDEAGANGSTPSPNGVSNRPPASSAHFPLGTAPQHRTATNQNANYDYLENDPSLRGLSGLDLLSLSASIVSDQDALERRASITAGSGTNSMNQPRQASPAGSAPLPPHSSYQPPRWYYGYAYHSRGPPTSEIGRLTPRQLMYLQQCFVVHKRKPASDTIGFVARVANISLNVASAWLERAESDLANGVADWADEGELMLLGLRNRAQSGQPTSGQPTSFASPAPVREQSVICAAPSSTERAISGRRSRVNTTPSAVSESSARRASLASTTLTNTLVESPSTKRRVTLSPVKTRRQSSAGGPAPSTAAPLANADVAVKNEFDEAVRTPVKRGRKRKIPTADAGEDIHDADDTDYSPGNALKPKKAKRTRGEAKQHEDDSFEDICVSTTPAKTPRRKAAVEAKQQLEAYSKADIIFPQQPHQSELKSIQVQEAWCLSTKFKDYEKCRACIRKNGDTCRFKDFRAFKKVGGKLVYGPYFLAADPGDQAPGDEQMATGELLARPIPTPESEEYILKTTAKAFQNLIGREYDFLSRQPVKYCRPPMSGVRQSCDVCQTSIFNAHWMCCVCGMELCSDCFDGWNEGEPQKRKGVTINACSYKRMHRKDQMIVVYRLAMEKVKAGLEDAKKWMVAEVTPAPSILPSSNVMQNLEEPLPFDIFADSGNYLRINVASASIPEFQSRWRNGEIVVVGGLLDRIKADWSPQFFLEKHGEDITDIVDCKTGAVFPMSVGTFFKGFLNREERHMHPKSKEEMILKLKDWPPTTDFETKFPEHFEDFMQLLPFKPYYHRSGELNLAPRLPYRFVPPDLGPKMYNAYGSDDGENGKGTTNLHLDMADAVNVMAYASDPPRRPTGESSTAEEPIRPAAAVWDIYAYKDLPAIRVFLKKYAEEQNFAYDEPVHDQRFYLNSTLRERLWREHGVRGWRVYQNPGDAVYVPAGCAHQVCNYRDAIKAAMDFVSPESVEKCEGLTHEFRLLGHTHRRRADLLQLKTIFWHAWWSCQENLKRWKGESPQRKKLRRGGNQEAAGDHGHEGLAGSSSNVKGKQKAAREQGSGAADGRAPPTTRRTSDIATLESIREVKAEGGPPPSSPRASVTGATAFDKALDLSSPSFTVPAEKETPKTTRGRKRKSFGGSEEQGADAVTLRKEKKSRVDERGGGGSSPRKEKISGGEGRVDGGSSPRKEKKSQTEEMEEAKAPHHRFKLKVIGWPAKPSNPTAAAASEEQETTAPPSSTELPADVSVDAAEPAVAYVEKEHTEALADASPLEPTENTGKQSVVSTDEPVSPLSGQVRPPPPPEGSAKQLAEGGATPNAEKELAQSVVSADPAVSSVQPDASPLPHTDEGEKRLAQAMAPPNLASSSISQHIPPPEPVPGDVPSDEH
ncbi:hypothetical protein HK104_010078 [Borealophlyctis nickersoniae]|nr:hypothetical protein HK104_010078 [Borealophlyctis nickersoniae]